MTTYFQRKVWMGFIAAIGLIAWLAFSSYSENRKFTETSLRVAHANRVLFHTEQILSLTIDLEAGQRGFTLTGKEEFLEPTNVASKALESHINTLAALTHDNPSQQNRIGQLRRMVDDKLTFTSGVIETSRVSFKDAQAMSASMVGKKLTDSIRRQVDEIQAEENSLVRLRTNLSEERVRSFYNVFSLLLIAVTIILIVVFYFIYVNLKRRTAAESELKRARDQIQDIYDNAPCGYHSLNGEGVIVEINKTWLDWLQYSRDEVLNKMKFTDLADSDGSEIFRTNFQKFKEQGFIKDLEFTVRRRDGTTFTILLNAVAKYDAAGNFVQSRSTAIDYTEQRLSLTRIEQLNKELESFSYSVSHDLRAPLRSIDGYTQILTDDYAQQMDDEGRRLLKVVVNNARRMGRLIDDLLDFSRVGRKEIAKATVSANNLVNSIIAEMKPDMSTRDIRFEVGPLPLCQADAGLLRQVWFNLISNAVKYTKKQENAVVTISGEQRLDATVYTIRDNGTGFDMQYAAKLFGVFQRLHRQQDFEGTGVGLAIVHRIVSRHGGKVWAEGKVNEGAVFSFSLPQT